MATKQEMLDNVETAINNILSGGAVQSYTISGRNLQKYSLGELRALRRELKAELAQESGSRNYVGFKGAS